MKVIQIIVLVLTILLLDFIGLGYVLNQHWNKQILSVQKSKMNINFYTALFSYLFLIIGLVVFVQPKVTTDFDCFYYGCMYALVVYGVFDMTNMTIFENYTLESSVKDIIWGMFVCSIGLYFSNLIK